MGGTTGTDGKLNHPGNGLHRTEKDFQSVAACKDGHPVFAVLIVNGILFKTENIQVQRF